VTHVCFYATATMRWIAHVRHWSVAFPAEHVTLFGTPRAVPGI